MLIHSLRNNLQLNLILLNSEEKYSLLRAESVDTPTIKAI